MDKPWFLINRGIEVGLHVILLKHKKHLADHRLLKVTKIITQSEGYRLWIVTIVKMTGQN
jgi:hypothetical protein